MISNCFQNHKFSFSSRSFFLFLLLFLTSTQNLLYLSVMLPILMIVGVIVLMVVVVCGDDTQALRVTISSLCSLNKVGQFASCCGSYDNGATITLEDSPVRTCFIYSLASTTGSVLTGLFVICFIFVLFLLFDDCHCFSSFFIFRSFYSRGLSVLGKDVFSSLTNLQDLFSLLLTLSSIHFFLHSFPSFLSFQSNNLVSIENGTFNGLNKLNSLSSLLSLFISFLSFFSSCIP